MIKIEVHLLTCNSDWILPWSLRHYCSFADKVVVHDGGPYFHEDAISRELCAAHGAIWERWDTAGQLNDELARHLKNEAWKGTDADWVMVVDCDELIYFPEAAWVGERVTTTHAESARITLERLSIAGAAVLRPEGFEMFSETMPTLDGFPQIWCQIREGAPDDKWYGKPVVFSPKLVAESGLGIGAHESRPVLKDGRALKVDETWPHPDPRCLLLHYHQIGPIEAVAARYDATRKRLSRVNEAHGWGNIHDTGIVHAQKKRDLILPDLRRVVK